MTSYPLSYLSPYLPISLPTYLPTLTYHVSFPRYLTKYGRLYLFLSFFSVIFSSLVFLMEAVILRLLLPRRISSYNDHLFCLFSRIFSALVSDRRKFQLYCWKPRLVGKSARHITELRAVFALRPLPNRPRLSCRVSGLVIFSVAFFIFPFFYFLCNL